MRLEQALYNRLSTSPGLAALVGDRLYPVRLPHPCTYPAVSYFRVSGPPIRTMGAKPSTRSRVQVDCWAKTYEAAKAAADQVIAALDGFDGQLGGGLPCQAAQLDNEMDDDFNDSADLYHVVLEFTIWHA